jgi:hypothetical protein
MKCFRIFVTLAIVSMFLAAAMTARRAEAITFGEPDTENRFSNVGAIVVVSGPPSLDYPIIAGSGVLIHPRVLLTAGHVTADIEAAIASGLFQIDDGRISFGTDAFDPATWVKVGAIVTHPDFQIQPESNSHDIGAIILKEPVDLPCAALPYEGLLDDLHDAGLLRDQGVPTRFLNVGYGATLEFPPPVFTPGGGLRRFSLSDYRALENVWLHQNVNPATGNGGTGYGDSGGPHFWIAPDGELIVVAVQSRGDPELVSLNKSYRLDSFQAQSFIEMVLALIEN